MFLLCPASTAVTAAPCTDQSLDMDRGETRRLVDFALGSN